MSTSEDFDTPYLFRIVVCGVETHRSKLSAGYQRSIWREAAMTASEMIGDIGATIEPGLSWRLEVSDCTERVIGVFNLTAELAY